jgi:alkaline phosphatase D
MSKKIIYYYQTFTDGLYQLFNNNVVTHIHLSAIHFGIENNECYIHLNDDSPYSKQFNHVWEDLSILKKQGVKIMLMIGGAGGAYGTFFSNYYKCYNLLNTLIINKRDIIDGIDLDIEEDVDIKLVIRLISRLKRDFGNKFIISMAPIQQSLETDNPGLGGFSYKELYKDMGTFIDYFNVQFYTDYSENAYERIINNGYPENKIVMGSISSQGISDTTKVVSVLTKKYKLFGGVSNWEYFDSPPSPHNPSLWALCMKNSFSIKLLNKNVSIKSK